MCRSNAQVEMIVYHHRGVFTNASLIYSAVTMWHINFHNHRSNHKETRQYLVWDKEGEKDTTDHVTSTLFQAADKDDEPIRGRSTAPKTSDKEKKAAKKRKADKAAKMKKASSSSSDSSRSSSQSSASSVADSVSESSSSEAS